MSTNWFEHSGRNNFILFLILIGIFGFAFYESIRILVGLWFEGEEAITRSGLLIVGCSAYLIYSKRSLFQRARIRPFAFGLAVLLVGTTVWLIGRVVDIQSVFLGVLPVILMGLVLSFLGWAVFKLSFLPLLLLFFATPIWWILTPHLQDIATVVTKFALNIINKPVLVEGNVLHLPGGSFFIDESCAGLRFLVVTFTLCFFCFDYFRLSMEKGGIFVLSGTFLALIANWIRILIVVLIGDHTEMQSELVNDHFTLGWVVYFFVVLIPMYVLSGALSTEYAIDGLDNRNEPDGSNASDDQKIPLIYAVLCSILLVYAPLLSYQFHNRANSAVLPAPPVVSENWILQKTSDIRVVDDWYPAYQNETNYTQADYLYADTNVNLHIVHYENQSQGYELINLENRIVDDESWFVESGSETVTFVEIASNESIAFNSAVVSNRLSGRKLVWYRFDVGGRKTHQTAMAKFFQLVAFFADRTDGTLLAVSIDCESDCYSKEAELARFVRDVLRSNPEFF